MNVQSLFFVLLGGAACIATTGCRIAPGNPEFHAGVVREDQIVDFPTLYKQNCAACHGMDGKNGAAIALDNPVYLMMAGVDNIKHITSMGLPGTLMPAFATKSGGTLTEAQVTSLARGMVEAWGNPGSLAGDTPLGYASHTIGVAAQGKLAFATSCATCHGTDGQGLKNNLHQTGSIVDTNYLALVSDQSLRSVIIAGRPDLGMPDWRSGKIGPDARRMTDQQVTDIVAWIGSYRAVAMPQASTGQPNPTILKQDNQATR